MLDLTLRLLVLQQLFSAEMLEGRAVEVGVNLARFDDIRAFISGINRKVSSPIRALVLNAALCCDLSGIRFTDQTGRSSTRQSRRTSLSTFLPMSSFHSSSSSPCTNSTAVSSIHPAAQTIPIGQRTSITSQAGSTTPRHALRKRLDKTPDLNNISIAGVDPGAVLHENIVQRASWANRNFIFPLMQLYAPMAGSVPVAERALPHCREVCTGPAASSAGTQARLGTSYRSIL
ncbi:hypothetical protein A7D00_2116 [Trichophyton violaceum]|uniref:Uncharacterized protein n=1 Tax=Trichophyton violaceum TaxID=34388 RepID=A0A178FQ54_TRIVO|nr:hypothetical protein A7D00_2116 [Trichophyton violaceum]